MFKRPSHKELFKKIREARAAIANAKVFLINPEAIACDALELGYVIEDELPKVLPGLLNEITPGHYVGKNPPEKSYQSEIEGLELFAFRVESSWFRCQVYLKFAVLDGVMWLVSLHLNRDKKGAT